MDESDRDGIEEVQLLSARSSGEDEPSLFKQAKVLHDTDSGHLDLRLQLAQRATVPLEENIEKEPARRVRQSLEDEVVVVHARTIRNQIVTCQGVADISGRSRRLLSPAGKRLVPPSSVACAMTAPVEDDTARDQLVVTADDATAKLEYAVEEDRLLLLHTEVPESFRGQGIGGRLVEAAVHKARTAGLTIVPWCPYARRWLKEHPDQAAGVSVDFKTPPPEQ